MCECSKKKDCVNQLFYGNCASCGEDKLNYETVKPKDKFKFVDDMIDVFQAHGRLYKSVNGEK